MANPIPSPETRFKPGRDWRGNPGGRPKRLLITSLLAEALERVVDARGTTVADLVVQAWISAARAGDIKAIHEMLDRVEGKALLRVEAPVEHRVVDEDLARILEAMGFVRKHPEQSSPEVIPFAPLAEPDVPDTVAIAESA
jgi:hypothetical protein